MRLLPFAAAVRAEDLRPTDWSTRPLSLCTCPSPTTVAPMPWDVITAIGTLFAGLALPLAFIQIAALRGEQQRAQINKIGTWTQADDVRTDSAQPQWLITLFIQNASELPVQIHIAELAVYPQGHKSVPASADGDPFQSDASNRTVPMEPAYFLPGMGQPWLPRTIPPGHKWRTVVKYTPEVGYDSLSDPNVSIIYLAMIDAAGRRWVMCPYRGSPPRRVDLFNWPFGLRTTGRFRSMPPHWHPERICHVKPETANTDPTE
jgi:hypothetical protein